MENLSSIIYKNCVHGPWLWPRPFLSLTLRGFVLEKSVLALDFFRVLGLGLECYVLDSTYVKNDDTWKLLDGTHVLGYHN